MFCPVCGDESTQGLNYCKRCGANLLTQSLGRREGYPFKPMGLVVSVAAVSMAGLIALFVTLYNLGERGVDGSVLIGIAAFGGATVFAVVGSLIWLLMKIIGAGSPTGISSRAPTTPPNILAPMRDREKLLDEAEAMPSVTENTTRDFDQVKIKLRDTQ
jgi:hypothetical protein